jgi:DNA invertase Pin-like site-specific DNA recombinase
MSTDLQLRGDSRRRQLEKSTAYAREHNLELADHAQLEDIGISAFKGANIKEGALGKFLRAVTEGRIERGSFLLIESLDRLSRQEVRKSLALFLSIIEAGITIVTLGHDRTYAPEKTDVTDLITSLVIMSRAHEESVTKSQRVAAAWANKRAQADTQPLTAKCPAWLKLSPDRKRYEEIPDRVKVVRSIFEDTVSGIGTYTITRRLNRRGINSFGGSNGWQNGYVSKILTNRAVIGEFQPHKRLPDGKRVPVGDPIANYFPAIVEEDLFYRAQSARAERRVAGRGRKGMYFTNLFSGMTTCFNCLSPMAFENKGAPPKGGTFLVCDGARRGMSCDSDATRWRYKDFEATFLRFVEEVDLEHILNSDDHEKKELDQAIESLRGELSTIKKRMDLFLDVMEKAEVSTDFVAGKLDELETRRAELDTLLKTKETERLDLDVAESAWSKDELKSLIHDLQNSRRDEIYKVRSQISARIRSLASEILLAPAGVPLEHGSGGVPRFFTVRFRNGNTRTVFPSKDDPLQYEEIQEGIVSFKN